MEAVPVLLQIQSLVFLQKAKTVEVNGQWQVVQGAEEVVGVEIEKLVNPTAENVKVSRESFENALNNTEIMPSFMTDDVIDKDITFFYRGIAPLEWKDESDEALFSELESIMNWRPEGKPIRAILHKPIFWYQWEKDGHPINDILPEL